MKYRFFLYVPFIDRFKNNVKGGWNKQWKKHHARNIVRHRRDYKSDKKNQFLKHNFTAMISQAIKHTF